MTPIKENDMAALTAQMSERVMFSHKKIDLRKTPINKAETTNSDLTDTMQEKKYNYTQVSSPSQLSANTINTVFSRRKRN